MGYREHSPPRSLADWVACTWEREGVAGEVVRVVPDGCVDIVWTEGAGTRVVGANTTAFVVALDEGTRVFGVRMRPGAAVPVLGVSGEAVRDARPELGEVWGDDGRRLADTLDATADRVRALLEALAARRPERPDPIVRAAAVRLQSAEASVAAVADELAISERQLRRRVARAVGYGPKRLARVLRLQRALAAARRGEELARVALDAGYADQAHFTNDCRELAGAPPSALL